MMRIRLGQSYSFHQQGQRGNQEDARFPDCNQPVEAQRFFVVCDGVGGSEKGEVASQVVCSTFGKALSRFDFTEDFTNSDFAEALNKAYDALDHAAHGHEDMATTLTFAAFHGGGATLAHIGDSRIYQIRPSEGIVYRSDDHSLVNQMVHSGIITPEEAAHHPQRNVITRCMEPVNEEQARCMATVFRTQDILPGDYFLLCTDGVLQQLSDEQLVELLTSDMSDEQKMKAMAQRCTDSSDNNTAFLIYIEEVDGRFMEEDATVPPNTMRVLNQQQNIEEIESVQQPRQENFLSKILRKLTNR